MEFSSMNVSGFEPFTTILAKLGSNPPSSSSSSMDKDTDSKISSMGTSRRLSASRALQSYDHKTEEIEPYIYPIPVSEITLSPGQTKNLSGKSHRLYGSKDVQVPITNKTSSDIRVQLKSDGFYTIYYPNGLMSSSLHGNPDYTGIKLIPTQKTYTEEYVK